MYMKPGRNDPCFCGSGKKYKKCCLFKVNRQQPEVNPLLSRSIKERNLILIHAVWDIFGFSKGKSWADIRKEMSDDQVRELYKVVGWLWPTNTDIVPLLPKPDKRLRGFYMGDMNPDLGAILQNIVRYSLYTDEILVVNPLMNPRCIAADYNPLEHPGLYKQDTLEMIYFILKLYPWIESGIVNMIPDPGDFDYQLRRSTWDMAKKRWEEQHLDLTEETKAKIKPRGLRMLEKTMYRLPDDKLTITIKRALPNLSDQQIKDQIEYVKRMRHNDPMMLDQELPDEGQMSINRNGSNLEMGMYIAQLTGSYLYTDLPEQWREILSSKQNPTSEGEMWSPLTKSFQSLEYSFLNNIDPKFAYDLKSEGRLENFRSFLRRIWVGINGNYSYDEAYKHARRFSEELQEEYTKAKEEWGKIDKELLKWVTGSGGLTAIISGGMDWQMPALGFCITAVGKLLEAHTDRKNFKTNVPLSIFLDLDKKDKIFK